MRGDAAMHCSKRPLESGASFVLARRLGCIAALVLATLGQCSTANAGLAAHFRFDGTVADETGQHPGSLMGTANYVAGVVGQALNFPWNGANQAAFVELANPTAIDLGKDFSISAWLRTTAQGVRVFLAKTDTNGWAFPGKQFMVNGARVADDCYGAGQFAGDFNVTDGQWHHVVLTYAATISPYWTWYVDGVRQDSYGRDFTVAADTASQQLRIGQRENGFSGFFVGQLDELQIYDVTLTAAEAQFLFQNPGLTITNRPPLPFRSTVFPRAAVPAASTISTLNVAGFTKPDLLMVQTFQGCINRTLPRVFLIGPGLVELQRGLSPQFWLDQMLGYTRTNFPDALTLIRAYTNELNGCVLYDPVCFTSTSDDNLARLNLVIMLCAKFGAIALTTNQLAELGNAGITLPVRADARVLGTNWSTIYSYALVHLAPFLRTNILHHLAGKNGTNFCLSNVDYLVAEKIFSFNFATTTTNALAIENQILALTPPNTPVIGVWGLDYGGGEHPFVSRVTASGKFTTVTYETANLSFTTGLPMYEPPAQVRRPLVLDTNKVYVAFTQTDGDNHSFVDRLFPSWLNVTNRVTYPLGWELLPTVNELNPVAAWWYSRNVGTTFVTPVTGIGYAWNKFASNGWGHLPEPHLGRFLQLTDAYMAEAKQSFIRTIWTDYQSALPYGALTNAIGVHIGYTGAGWAVSNVPAANFISRGKAFFHGYDFASQMADIAQYNGPTPAFFSVGCQYVPIASIVSAANQLSGQFVVVSPPELADLFRQHRTNDVIASEKLLRAEFSPLDAAELLYLYQLAGAQTNGLFGGTRFADLTNYWAYQFNLDPRVKAARLELTLYGHYRVSASSNSMDWETVAEGADVQDGSNLATITLDVTRFLGGTGGNLFVRFHDASPDTHWGAALTRVKLTGFLAPRVEHIAIHESQVALSGNGGTPGETFRLLGSTNLALSPAPWSVLATNRFGALGSFVLTNAVISGAGNQFYRLQSP